MGRDNVDVVKSENTNYLLIPFFPAQKRLEQQKQIPAGGVVPAASTASSTATTVSTPQKVVVGPLTGPVPTGTKVVLTTKVGSPATVTFQQNKNFHQTFATWVKQGQSSTGKESFVMEGALLEFILCVHHITSSPDMQHYYISGYLCS